MAKNQEEHFDEKLEEVKTVKALTTKVPLIPNKKLMTLIFFSGIKEPSQAWISKESRKVLPDQSFREIRFFS